MPTTAVAVAKIALLEDEPRVAEKLEAELKEIPGTIVKIADSYRDFTKLIKSEEFDAASIDWELHGVEKGGEALRLLARTQPFVAKVVFTKHELRRSVAEALKADACLVKGTDMAEYQEAMGKAVRLGQARQIAGHLEHLNQGATVPDLPAGRWVNEEEEGMLRETAQSSIVENALLDTGFPSVESLQQALERRGWWTPFNTFSYAELPWGRKLEALCRYSGLNDPEIAAILQLQGSENLEDLLCSGRQAQVRGEILDRADALLSILAYQLRNSGYRPNVMQVMCQRPALYEGCREQPPWDSRGLISYLKEAGLKGLMESFGWIRR